MKKLQKGVLMEKAKAYNKIHRILNATITHTCDFEDVLFDLQEVIRQTSETIEDLRMKYEPAHQF